MVCVYDLRCIGRSIFLDCALTVCRIDANAGNFWVLYHCIRIIEGITDATRCQLNQFYHRPPANIHTHKIQQLIFT